MYAFFLRTNEPPDPLELDSLAARSVDRGYDVDFVDASDINYNQIMTITWHNNEKIVNNKKWEWIGQYKIAHDIESGTDPAFWIIHEQLEALIELIMTAKLISSACQANIEMIRQAATILSA
jgi:hypothetical protein